MLLQPLAIRNRGRTGLKAKEEMHICLWRLCVAFDSISKNAIYTHAKRSGRESLHSALREILCLKYLPQYPFMY